VDRIPIGCCGDDCNYCPRYIATVKNDTETLRRAAVIWYRMGWRDKVLSPEEMKCYGCISVKSCVFGIKECCRKKHIDNCGYCSTMPCDELKRMFDSIKEARKSVENLIKEGLVSKEENEALNKAFWSKEERLIRIAGNRIND